MVLLNSLGGGVMLLLDSVTEMITALGLGFGVNFPDTSRNINVDFVASLHLLAMLLLLVAVGKIITPLRLMSHHLMVQKWLQLLLAVEKSLTLLGLSVDVTAT
jgi:hypothetical protein